MALLKTISYGERLFSYHRIGKVMVRAASPHGFELEHYVDLADRVNAVRPMMTTVWEFVFDQGDPIDVAYVSLRMHPQWQDAEGDGFPGVVAQAMAMPHGTARWDGQAWVPLPQAELVHIRESAMRDIDSRAGAARLRYITSVPGQSETYQRKEQQAQEWQSAGFSGAPPSFIAAEAQALGVDPVDLAVEIIQMADLWVMSKGPAIEAARRAGKVAAAAALTPQAVEAARLAAIAALDAL